MIVGAPFPSSGSGSHHQSNETLVLAPRGIFLSFSPDRNRAWFEIQVDPIAWIARTSKRRMRIILGRRILPLQANVRAKSSPLRSAVLRFTSKGFETLALGWYPPGRWPEDQFLQPDRKQHISENDCPTRGLGFVMSSRPAIAMWDSRPGHLAIPFQKTSGPTYAEE